MTQNNGRNWDKTITAGRRRGAFIAESIAIALLLAVGAVLWIATPAHADMPTSPGPNFNMTVPPIVVEQPAPAPDMASQEPASQQQAIQAQAPATDTTVVAQTTPPTTAAPLPDCPTNGTEFAYGTCHVPDGVTDTGAQLSFSGTPIASPGAPSKVCTDPGGAKFTCPENLQVPGVPDRTQDVPSSADDTTGTTVVGTASGAQAFHAS